MYAYADLSETATRSGYNPLMEDFRNTCFFLAESSSYVASLGREEEEDDDDGRSKVGRRGGDRIDQILADVRRGKKVQALGSSSSSDSNSSSSSSSSSSK